MRGTKRSSSSHSKVTSRSFTSPDKRMVVKCDDTAAMWLLE